MRSRVQGTGAGTGAPGMSGMGSGSGSGAVLGAAVGAAALGCCCWSSLPAKASSLHAAGRKDL